MGLSSIFVQPRHAQFVKLRCVNQTRWTLTPPESQNYDELLFNKYCLYKIKQMIQILQKLSEFISY